MLTKIIKQNDIVKEDVEDFYEFHFSLLSYLKFLFAWHLSIAFEKVTGRIVSNSLFLWEVTRFYNRLWGFSASKPTCFKDVFDNTGTLWL